MLPASVGGLWQDPWETSSTGASLVDKAQASNITTAGLGERGGCL